jgi:hypothetical protein
MGGELRTQPLTLTYRPALRITDESEERLPFLAASVKQSPKTDPAPAA